MKSLAAYICATLNLISWVVAEQPSKQLGFRCEILVPFYQLWKDSGFGKDPNRTERSAWMVLHPNGLYEFRRWPCSGGWNKDEWKGPVPHGTIALAHTHPVGTDPRPSMKDRILAGKTSLAVYTISDKGIWKAMPDETVTKEANAYWWRSLDRNECSEIPALYLFWVR